MNKKFYTILLLSFLFFSFTACSSKEENESITATGIEDTCVNVGDIFSTSTGINFKSSTRGDITTNVVINGRVNTKNVDVYPITYQIKKQDGSKLTFERNIIVLNPPEKVYANLLKNGDFSDFLNYWSFEYSSGEYHYIDYKRDNDLERLSVKISYTSDDYYSFITPLLPIVIDESKRYSFSILVATNDATSFKVDMVEEDYEDGFSWKQIVDPQIIDVNSNTTIVNLTFSPLYSTNKGVLRLIFSSDDEMLNKTIYLDNISLKMN